MAKTLSLAGQFASTNAVPNIDSYYGPYSSKQQAIDTLVGDGSRSKAANGLTIGIFEAGKVVDYVFQNIISGSTPTVDNLVVKVSNKQVIMYKGSKSNENIIGSFTLNETSDGTIEIIVPDSAQADWDAVSGPSAILNKPNLATVATSGSYNDLNNKPSNLVYFTPVTPPSNN